jgi:hypothetical protein
MFWPQPEHGADGPNNLKHDKSGSINQTATFIYLVVIK